MIPPLQPRDHPKFRALMAEGLLYCEAYTAARLGVKVNAAGILAGLKRVNAGIDNLLSRDYPELHAEVQREEHAIAADKYRE